MIFGVEDVDPDSPLALRAADLARTIVTAKVDPSAAGGLSRGWGEALDGAIAEADREPGLSYLLTAALATFAGAAVELASEFSGVSPLTVLEVLAVKFEKEGLGL